MATRDWRIEAAGIWPILVAIAASHETMTYGELGSRVAIMHRNLDRPLDIIARHVHKIGLPPLTVVVVNAETKRPGKGIFGSTAEQFEEHLALVHAREWARDKNPFSFFVP